MEVFLTALGIVIFYIGFFSFGWWLGGATYRYWERKNR